MTDSYPLLVDWDGEVFKPANSAWAKRADEKFIVGERYTIEVREARSEASHRQFFALVNETWQNLPDDLAARFPTADHLRRWALIRAGFRDERSIVCASKAEAQRIAAFVKPMDGYAVVVVRDAVVIVYTAKSQSMKAMGKADFQRSKQAVLDIVAELIGHTGQSLQKNTGEAA